MHPVELGRYRIVRPLGRGGMGVVYEAHDPRIDRPVAIKTIALTGLDAREAAMFEARFEAEMRFAGRLQHQHIAALYDTGREGDIAYIVMELVPGQDLRRLLAAGRRFEPVEAIGIVGQLLAALDYAHRRQVIHRDVKPANVMLQDDGLVKLCDFGVARPADDEATRTQGVMVGSLHYASPEQIAGLPIDIRTDIFSTGALLFELLTGERPFKGASEAEVLNRIAHADTPSCLDLAPQVPPEVDAAIRRALAKRPADRFPSAEAFAQALGVPLYAAGGTGSTPLRPTPPPEPSADAVSAPPGVSRKPLWIGGGALAGLALLWGMFGRSPADPANAPAAALRVAASASATASEALATEAMATPSVSIAGSAALAPGSSSGGLPASAPMTAAPAAGALAGAMPASSAVRSVAPPSPGTASAVGSPPTSPPVPAPAASRPSRSPSPARAERLADAPVDPAASRPGSTRVGPSPSASRPTQGPWQARLSCGPNRLTGAAKGSEAFGAGFTIDVDWPRLSWRRETQFVSTHVAGHFDEGGRFQAEGQGARKDRVEAWLERAEGSYVPSSRSIVGRLQLLRTRDNAVARDCELTATPGVSPAPASALAGSPAGRVAASAGAAAVTPAAAGGSARTASVVPDPAAPAVPQGAWDGELFCTAAAGADASAPAGRPFTTPAVVTVEGRRLRITREGASISESSEGSIDDKQRFTAVGTGHTRLRRSSWTVQVQGEFLHQPTRLQGRVQLLRSEDGSVARECSLRARPRS